MTENAESQLKSRSFGIVVFESVWVSVAAILTIIGNLLVLLAVYRNPQLRKVHNVYVACLAFSDFFMGVTSFPIVIAVLITGKLPGGEPMCWFHATTTFYLALVSIHTMAMISVQRYYKVVKPNQHNGLFSCRRVILSVCFIWSIVAAIILLSGFTARSVRFLEEFPICVINMDVIIFFTVFLSIGIILPYVMMFYFYLKIWKFMKAHNSHIGNSNVNVEEVKLTKLLCFVLGTFAVFFFPYAFCIAGRQLGMKLPRKAAVFVQILASTSYVVNPLIYGVMNREFRKEFSKFACCWRKSRNAANIETVA